MVSERNWDADWELCEKATPGPWNVLPGRAFRNFGVGEHIATVGVMDDFKIEREDQCGYCLPKDNAHFIAEARTALPYWLQRVKELEAENARLQTVMEAAEELAEHRHEQIVPIDLLGKLIDAVDAYKVVNNS